MDDDVIEALPEPLNHRCDATGVPTAQLLSTVPDRTALIDADVAMASSGSRCQSP